MNSYILPVLDCFMLLLVYNYLGIFSKVLFLVMFCYLISVVVASASPNQCHLEKLVHGFCTYFSAPIYTKSLHNTIKRN